MKLVWQKPKLVGQPPHQLNKKLHPWTSMFRSSFILSKTYPQSSVTPPLAGPSGRRTPVIFMSKLKSFGVFPTSPITEGWLEIDKHYSLELCFSIEKQPETVWRGVVVVSLLILIDTDTYNTNWWRWMGKTQNISVQ